VKENNDNKSVFFFCYHLTTVIFIIVNMSLFLFVSFEAYAVSSQQPSIVSNNNNLSNTPSDTIHKTVNAMMTNNMVRLMNDTILSSMANPTSKVVATNNNSSHTTTNNTAGTMSSQSNSTNTSGAVTKNNNNQTHMDENENKRRGTIKSPIMVSDSIIDSNQEQQPPALNNNNTKTFADNQPVVLQIQKSTDTDIANKLEDIKNKLLNQSMAINKNNLTATIKSIEESNNIIIKELSEIKSLINGSSSSPTNPLLSPSVISGTISAAIIVSVVAIPVFLWVYNNNTGGGIKKLNHMKLWRK
jgi:hypothetical protein